MHNLGFHRAAEMLIQTRGAFILEETKTDPGCGKSRKFAEFYCVDIPIYDGVPFVRPRRFLTPAKDLTASRGVRVDLSGNCKSGHNFELLWFTCSFQN